MHVRFMEPAYPGAKLTMTRPTKLLVTDVKACRLRLLATIEERAVIEKVLMHLGLPIEVPPPAPARLTGALAAAEPAAWIDG